MIDIEERFDRAWAGEPAHVPAPQRLTVAHRQLRRRRTAIAAGVLGAVVTLGGVAVVLPGLPGADRVQVSQVTGDQPIRIATEAEIATLLASPVDRLPPGWGEPAAAYAPDGDIVVRPGWVVVEQVDDYLTRTADRTAALAVEHTDTEDVQWVFLKLDPDERSSVVRWGSPADLGDQSLRAAAESADANWHEFLVPGETFTR